MNYPNFVLDSNSYSIFGYLILHLKIVQKAVKNA